MPLGESYFKKVLISTTGRPFLITAKDWTPKTVQNGFEHRTMKDPWYLVIVNRSWKCTIQFSHGIHCNLFFFDEYKANMCIVIRPEEMKLPTQRVFFGHENARRRDSGWNRRYRSRHHLYTILEDVYLKDAVAFAHGD